MTEGFQLTADESALVRNSEWIHTKHRIVAKVYQLFGTLSEKYQALIAEGMPLPDEVKQVSPKIYKGERYLDLPYVMLDYPRYFTRDDVFAIRSFFWWGNHFSIHLVLGGKYRELYGQRLAAAFRAGNLEGWYAGISDDPWQHHFAPDNYQPVKMAGNLTAGNYLKLGRWLDLEHWEHSTVFFIEFYKKIISFLS
jgi:hypothetical protein